MYIETHTPNRVLRVFTNLAKRPYLSMESIYRCSDSYAMVTMRFLNGMGDVRLMWCGYTQYLVCNASTAFWITLSA